jgi:hypothetical protein
MKWIILLVIMLTLLATSAFAGDATAIGTGVGISKSTAVSASRATAISGQGGSGTGVGSVTIQGTQVPTQTFSTIDNTGTSTVKNVPSVFAPGLAAAGLETCLGSVSGGGSFVGTGFSFGSTIPDPGCGARLDARTLWSMGLRKAAIARLCLNPDINRSMPEICGTYLPQAQPVGYGGYYLSADSKYQGGPIMLVEGRTGQDRLCNNYDATRQRCRVWAGAVSHRPAKKLAAVSAPQAASPPPIKTSETSEGKPQ